MLMVAQMGSFLERKMGGRGDRGISYTVPSKDVPYCMYFCSTLDLGTENNATFPMEF